MILNLLLALVGAGLVIFGLFLMWPPLAPIFAGAVLLVIAFGREVPDAETR